ncbi:MAG: cytochrome c, partial [Acidimicrobiales bacterium]
VVALSPADYADWEANQTEGAEVPEDELAAAGMEAFRTQCSQCHLISGEGGRLNVADLEAWLRDPPGEKPMAPDQSRGMPNLNLTEEQIDALVAYLETLE